MSDRIAYPDQVLLRVDNPNNPMVITVLMTFDTPLDYERLKATLEKSLLRFKRFHQRLIKPNFPFLRPYWEDDPNFHFDAHLCKVELPLPADQKALQDLVSSSMSTGLEPSRPLWKFYYVENYGKGSALIARIHHSLADGISLMQVLLSMTDPDNKPGACDLAHRLAQDKLRSPNGKGKASRSKILDSSNRRAKFLWNEGKQIIFDPSHARHRARQITDITATVGRLVIRWPDPQTNLKGSLGKEKRAAWSEPIVLEEVKLVGKEFHCTVNDVLLSAVAGALGQYIVSRAGTVEPQSISSFLPVNLRPIEHDEELGNKFGVVLLSLPVGIADPVERLYRVKQNMDQLKSSSEPVTSFGIINIIGAVPSWIQDIAVDFIDAKGTTVISNVPGPQTQLYVDGAPINTVMAWVPQFGRIGLGISIISYNGSVRLGIATDQDLVPDPEAILASFQLEYDLLRCRVQQNQLEQKNDVEALFSALDKAIQTLDELLAESKPGQTISYQTSRDLTDARSSGDSIGKLHHSRQMKNQPEHS